MPGMGLGAFVWGRVADVFGRRISVLVSTGWCFVFGVLSAVASTYSTLLLCRFLVGTGLGGIHVVMALFLEFVPSGSRGLWSIGAQMGRFVCVFWLLGVFV
jgi:MFS family permease